MKGAVMVGRVSNGSRNATLRDVAALAGVSISTASKALNGRFDVNAGTRTRVREAADLLSFSPNQLARGLLSQRTGTVGLLTSDLEGRFSIPILMGAEDAFGSDKISVFLCDARGDAIREQHHIRALLSRRVDGLIVVGARPDPRASLGHDLGVPVVYAYAPSDDPGDASLVSDQHGGGRLAIKHLLECRRRRIAHITGDVSYSAARERAAGAVASLREAGLDIAGGQVFYGAWSESWGRTATIELLRREPQVDAIFAGSDQIARGVLDVLDRADVSVPDQVSVVGFDNWLPLVTNARPTLTTIDMNLQLLGRMAAQRLFAAMSDEVAPPSSGDVIPCQLVVRDSSAFLDSPAD